ncbi:MAG: methyltransferase domain-containing protein, partial [Chloroflexi bacterium]|nr:methyltransferase domain-containing protein [Chloroflexota bacterium]
YRPLSDAINELVYGCLREQQGASDEAETANILDAGCGEGYYAGRLQHYLSAQQAPVSCWSIGIDISKEAVRMAAKRYKDALFVVANLKERLVLVDEAIDVLLNIFAPRNAAEFARVIAPKGLLLVVIPGPSHLLQLRSKLKLLSIEENKQQHVVGQFAGWFELVNARSIAYELHLRRDEIGQAVMMTPNYWHLSDEMRKAMEVMEEIGTEAEFVCMAFRRK